MSACKMMTFKTNLNVLLKKGQKIIESQMPFKVPMKRNLVFRFFQYFKSLNTKTCLAFQKIETPAIELKINRYWSPICGELCLRGQRVQ